MMFTKLVTRRLRDKLDEGLAETSKFRIDRRVFGTPTYAQYIFEMDQNVDFPCAFVVDERDEALPLDRSRGSNTAQQNYTYISIAVGYSRIDKKEAGQDLAYIDFYAGVKQRILNALLGWGVNPENALVTTGDLDDHGERLFEYLGSENVLHRTGHLFYIYNFRVLYWVDNLNPNEVIDPLLQRIINTYDLEGDLNNPYDNQEIT